jgi:hypothetical protein
MTKSIRNSLFALAVIVGAAPAMATDADNANCKQEMRRVTVWPQGGNPKNAQVGRVETREVTVCNGKVVSQKPELNAANAEKGTR